MNTYTTPTYADRPIQHPDHPIPWLRLVGVSLALQLVWLAMLFGGWRLSDVVAGGDSGAYFLIVLGVPLLLMELAIGPMLLLALLGASLAGLSE